MPPSSIDKSLEPYRVLDAHDVGADIVAAAQGISGLGLFDAGILDVKIGIAGIELAETSRIPLATNREPDPVIIGNPRRAIVVANRRAVIGDTEFQLQRIVGLIGRSPGKTPGVVVIESFGSQQRAAIAIDDV